MPHAVSPHDDQDAQDNALIQQALDPQSQLDFNRDLEPGEKADDAVDFGDLSDNDLADEEDLGADGVDRDTLSPTVLVDDAQREHSPILGSSIHRDEFSDLFGEDAPPPPERGQITTQVMQLDDGVSRASWTPSGSQLHDQSLEPTAFAQSLETIGRDDFPLFVEPRNHGVSFSKEQQIQQELFALSRSGLSTAESLPQPPENHEELLAALWPKFERNITPRFMDLLPPKKAKYVGREISKPTKSINPTKIKLELAEDQEKAFRLSSGYTKHANDMMDRSGTVAIYLDTPIVNGSDEDVDTDSDCDNNGVQGISWHDFQVLCGDWESFGCAASDTSDELERTGKEAVLETAVDDMFIDQERERSRYSAKVSIRPTGHEQVC